MGSILHWQGSENSHIIIRIETKKTDMSKIKDVSILEIQEFQNGNSKRWDKWERMELYLEIQTHLSYCPEIMTFLNSN